MPGSTGQRPIVRALRPRNGFSCAERIQETAIAMGDAKPEESAGREPSRFVLHAPLLLHLRTAGRCPARQARGLSYGPCGLEMAEPSRFVLHARRGCKNSCEFFL